MEQTVVQNNLDLWSECDFYILALNKQIALILSFVKAGEDSMMYLVAVNMLSECIVIIIKNKICYCMEVVFGELEPLPPSI